jgi:hypothetical protein
MQAWLFLATIVGAGAWSFCNDTRIVVLSGPRPQANVYLLASLSTLAAESARPGFDRCLPIDVVYLGSRQRLADHVGPLLLHHAAFRFHPLLDDDAAAVVGDTLVVPTFKCRYSNSGYTRGYFNYIRGLALYDDAASELVFAEGKHARGVVLFEEDSIVVPGAFDVMNDSIASVRAHFSTAAAGDGASPYWIDFYKSPDGPNGPADGTAMAARRGRLLVPSIGSRRDEDVDVARYTVAMDPAYISCCTNARYYPREVALRLFATMLRQFTEFDCAPHTRTAVADAAPALQQRRPSLRAYTFQDSRAAGIAERQRERQHATSVGTHRTHSAYDPNQYAAMSDYGYLTMAAHPAVVLHIGHRSSHLGPEKLPSADIFRELVSDQKSGLHPLFNDATNFDALVFDAVDGRDILASGCHA